MAGGPGSLLGSQGAAETMGIGGGVLAYLHTIFPVLPAHLLRDFVKQ